MRWIALLLVAALLPINPTLKAQTQLGGDIDGETGSQFGISISTSSNGNRIAAGGPYPNTTNGFVRIYEWDGSNWGQLGNDIIGENVGDRSGWSVSLSSDGSIIAIGAVLNDDNGSNAGQTRIYEWNGTNWTQLGNDINGESANDRSGYSVSLSSNGHRVAIGAWYNDGNGSNAGHTRIYEWNGTSWTQLGSDIDGEFSTDYSGSSVSLSSNGERVAIGAWRNDENGTDAGHARIYEWNGTNWIQLGNDIDGEDAGDYSAYSVSLSSDGSRIAIGAPDNDDNGSDAGHVRIYEWNGTNWIQLGSNIDGEASHDHSGWSVSLSSNGNRVAIGAPDNDGNGNNTGHVRIYEWNGTNWIQLGSDIDGEEGGTGYTVSLAADGNEVVVGAPLINGNTGQISIYSLSSLLPVELSIFEGFLGKSQVNLHWTTASETDNKGFDIQRSKNGKTWQTLGFVEGRGTTNTTHHYEYIDPQPQKGINYYRLKQIDFDGTFEYSKTIAVAFENTEGSVQIYPNPTSGTLNLNIDNPTQKALQINIHNNLGQTIWQSSQIENTSQYQENLQLNKSGLYYITVRMGAEFLYERVVVE